MKEKIEMEIGHVIEYCDCDNGMYTYSGMGADNMDVWSERDVCSGCDGHHYYDIHEVEEVVSV